MATTENTVDTVQEENETGVQETTSTSVALAEIISGMEDSLKTMKNFVSEVRALKKEVSALEKLNSKLKNKSKRRKRRGTGSPEAGFGRPIPISDQLADFIVNHTLDVVKNDDFSDISKSETKVEARKKENEDLVSKIENLAKSPEKVFSRTDVTKLINRFVKFHKLQDPEAKRFILLDNEKGRLFKEILSPIVDDDGNETQLTFINIQRYIKHQYPKTDSPSVETEGATTEDTAVEGSESATAESATVESTEAKPVKKKVVKKVLKKKPAVSATA